MSEVSYKEKEEKIFTEESNNTYAEILRNKKIHLEEMFKDADDELKSILNIKIELIQELIDEILA